MKKRSLVVPTIYLLIIFSITVGLYFVKMSYDDTNRDVLDNINYVSGSILNRTIPVIEVPDLVTSPFEVQGVSIARYFYNADDTIEMREKSLVYYNDTYMPNTGVDYTYNTNFDVLSIYDGTVIDIKDDELLGKTVEVRHNNEIISVYQGLSSVDVKKGDMVFLGFKLGVSGTSKLNEKLGNHVHLEIIKNGEVIDPMKCIGKKLGDI